jgi:hypothetical protein
MTKKQYKKYTMDWVTLIHSYNKKHVGQLTQIRLAEVFNQSGAVISLDQTIPRSLNNLENKYKTTYIKLFEKDIPFTNILVEHKKI